MGADHRRSPGWSRHQLHDPLAPSSPGAWLDETAALDLPYEALALRTVLLDMMESAGLFELRTETLAHPRLEELEARIRPSARQVMLDNSTSVESILWTAPAALWYGAMAKALDAQKTVGAGDGAALLLAFASDAGPNGLLWRNARSLRAMHGFHGNFAAGGPYLVLMKCSLQWPNDVIVDTGFVLPVLDGHYGLPVRSHLARDVCRTLIRMMELLDCEGGEVAIRRERQVTGPSACIAITVASRRGMRREKRIICDPPDCELAPPDPMPDSFVVRPSSIGDLTFTKWPMELVRF